jgi:aspartate/methionine/tyrosine aminotransferase
MDIERLIADRARRVDASGIRRIANLGKSLPGAINLSIGQPDFPVPEAVRKAAADAVMNNRNGYTANPGLDELRDAIAERLKADLGWACAAPHGGAKPDAGLIITSGTSGAIMLALMAVLGPGDEVVIPDPYFVMYPHVATMCDASAVRCDTYPDFRLTAERVEPLLTPRTKAILLNSPGNPSGVVAPSQDLRDLLDLCRRRNIVLISDEIYDEFAFSESRTELAADRSKRLCPSPARLPGAHDAVLLVRGFGKTYGCTGWRLGYAAGPAGLIEQMTKLQQYTFVCAPTPLQWGVIEALRTDIAPIVNRFEARRNRVVERLSKVTEVATPGGAFYAFFKVPERLGESASAYVERAIARKVLVIPGNVFSARDTHVRLSFAAKDDELDRGLDVLCELMR